MNSFRANRDVLYCQHCGQAGDLHSGELGEQLDTCRGCGERVVHQRDLLTLLGFDFTIVGTNCGCGAVSSGRWCWNCGEERAEGFEGTASLPGRRVSDSNRLPRRPHPAEFKIRLGIDSLQALARDIGICGEPMDESMQALLRKVEELRELGSRLVCERFGEAGTLCQYCHHCGEQVDVYLLANYSMIENGCFVEVSGTVPTYWCSNCDEDRDAPTTGTTGQGCIHCGMFNPLDNRYCPGCSIGLIG